MLYIPKKPNNTPINVALVNAIDAFMSANKFLAGIDSPMNWQPGRELGSDEYIVKIPIEVNSEISGQKLIVNSYPNAETMKFSILISFEPAICRLDWDVGAIHINSHATNEENISPTIHGVHYHPWELNKRFFTHSSRSIKLHNAIEFDQGIQQFDSSLRWFCDKNRITLPHNHRIELPRNGDLF